VKEDDIEKSILQHTIQSQTDIPVHSS